MRNIYRLHVNDLSTDLLKSIRNAFKEKIVEIVVTESMDETEYLLATEANRKSLERAMKEVEEGQVITLTVEELKERYGVK